MTCLKCRAEAGASNGNCEGENVHHKNGIKDDNRPENLELWIRPQPSGMRATDAVAWARDILTKYGVRDRGFAIEPPY